MHGIYTYVLFYIIKIVHLHVLWLNFKWFTGSRGVFGTKLKVLHCKAVYDNNLVAMGNINQTLSPGCPPRLWGGFHDHKSHATTL